VILDLIADTNFIKPSRYGANRAWRTWPVTVSAVPEVSGPGAPELLVSKGISGIDLTFSDTGSSRYNLYVSNSPGTGPFRVDSPLDGKKSCALAGLIPGPGPTWTLGGYDTDAGITGPRRVLFILVTADNGPGTEGTLGSNSASAERSADSRCAP
jgi:hypothetical protein